MINLEKSFLDQGSGDPSYIHGDIQPKTCHIDPEGFIKLIDGSLINPYNTAYQKMLYDREYTAAISPQLLEELHKRKASPKSHRIKDEVWSIGMTTLCAALNKNIDDYYDWNAMKVNMQKIHDDYEMLREIGYSEQMIATINGCLELAEDRRSTLNEIIEFLAPYQDAIRKGQFQFNPNWKVDVN